MRRVLDAAAWKDDDPLPVYDKDYDEVVEELPANFHDDLHTKPEAHRQWRWDQQHGLWGYIDPGDTKAWLRHLDYYVELQRLADESLGTVLGALEDSRCVGRHRGDLHLGPRRHVRLTRPAVQGPLRLRRDHAGAAVRARARRDAAGIDHRRPRPPTSTWPRRSAPWPVSIPTPPRAVPGVGAAGCRPVARCSPIPPRRCATTCCSPRTRRRRGTSTRFATPCAASSTGGPSTPATTAWAAASRRPACGARTRAASSSTSTATSTTRTTSGTTTTPIRSSSSTWPTTGPGAPNCGRLFERLRELRGPGDGARALS